MTRRPPERIQVPANGLTPADRSGAVAEAKAVALKFTVAVRHDDAAELQRIRNGLSPAAWSALPVVLAEAVDARRLLDVARAGEDDGMPGHVMTRADRKQAAS